jgi:hypothetical protein
LGGSASGGVSRASPTICARCFHFFDCAIPGRTEKLPADATAGEWFDRIYFQWGGSNRLCGALSLSRITVEVPGKDDNMSVKGEIKEGAGFIKEEMNEHGKSPESKAKAQEGRDLRNEGRVEDGKAPKTTKPGTGHPEK